MGIYQTHYINMFKLGELYATSIAKEMYHKRIKPTQTIIKHITKQFY
jgi:hypothetical protein